MGLSLADFFIRAKTNGFRPPRKASWPIKQFRQRRQARGGAFKAARIAAGQRASLLLIPSGIAPDSERAKANIASMAALFPFLASRERAWRSAEEEKSFNVKAMSASSGGCHATPCQPAKSMLK